MSRGLSDTTGESNRVLDIPELLPCHEWAAKYRLLPSEVTAKAGLYDVNVTPWMREPQESFDDPDVMTTVLCLASRLGKTEGLLNLIGRTIHTDPSNMLMVYPTIDSAKKWAKEFLNPMFESNHCFDALISDPAKRDGENTMLSKRYPGGRISGIGANSPSAFRQVQARLVLFDEIDAMESSREGDPITLGMKRADNYADSIQVLSSTTTIKDQSRIWAWLMASDFRQWFVPSPFAGEEKRHVLAWENVQWLKSKPETAVYVDPFTDDEWTEERRKEAVMAGLWEPTQQFKGIRGYQSSGLVSLFAPKKGYKSKYHQFASEFLDAKHAGTEELKVWTNTFLCQPWEDQVGEAVDWRPIYDRREEYEAEPLPERVLMVTFAADVQADRIEYEWVGWAENYESYGLQYGVISGDTKRGEIWERLHEIVIREFEHEAGGSVRLTRGFVDEGHNPEQVRMFCLKLLQSGIEVYPVKGLGRAGITEPELIKFNPNKRQSGIKAPTWNVGVNRAKRSIYAHLSIAPPGANTMRWTDNPGSGYDERYFEMLTSERAVQKYQYGQPYTAFVNKSGQRNEALDIRAYGYACAVSVNPSWEAFRKMIERRASKERHMESKSDDQSDLPKPKAAPSKRGRRKGGWVNRWK